MTTIDWLKQFTAQGSHLRLDSRDIQKGDVFVACKGHQVDGARFIQNAIDNGAVAVLVEKGLVVPPTNIPVQEIVGLRQQLGSLADEWYGHPSQQLMVIAITGTNGKTSCVNWVARALNNNNIPCATIGTLGTILPTGENLGGSLTTPDVLSIHRLLAELLIKGIKAVAIEASSIGLEQGRLDNVNIQIAGFTNLTLDHLDIHQTMQEYERCKGLLFAWKNLEHAIINVDDDAGKRFFQQTIAKHKLAYTIQNLSQQYSPALSANHIDIKDKRIVFDLLTSSDNSVRVETKLVGDHNVSNLLLVVGVLQAMGFSLEKIIDSISSLEPVHGRLEIVTIEGVTGNTLSSLPLVVVDYSHTPDSLLQALKALRPSATEKKGKLICVFGCGGDRDPTKRPVMGKIAAEKADLVYVTSDNPRTEDPQQILNQILQAMPKETFVNVDRAESIVSAILKAKPEDVILIAGKGHETYQEINHHKYPFDDSHWAKLALLLKSGAHITTDSRAVKKGDIFVALKGDNFDAHQFLQDVAEKGAAAAIVNHVNPNVGLEQFVVDDTLRALSQVARAWRLSFDIPIIAVTGSNGKTTCKEMIASILRAYVGEEHCLATVGNLNNHIGVPLSLLRLNSMVKVAVFELGMNHPGEIATLAHLTQPLVAMVNNAQREHQEFMKTVEAVAYENGEVFKFLPANGTAVYPADETYTSIWKGLSEHVQQILFGEQGNVWASNINTTAGGTSFILHYDAPVNAKIASAQIPITLSIPGDHNVRNALAAAACALAIKIPLATIAEGLLNFSGAKGRMQKQVLDNGTVLIDDTYNANPDSVIAAIDVMTNLPQPGLLVLGDMGEVGDNGPAMHAEVGHYAKEKGIQTLFAMGELCQESVNAFGEGALHFTDIDELINAITTSQYKTILVKGSRFMRMERVVQALLSR
ncbi:UDP-N-acetylmuramoylalanyl-D-glutamate--2,6-diaminopimelate ligase [Pelistega indica]|uniref:Multifunctional fusion protein n=1 Tax=Pelistega indica TaxID=1414851 RepID=V8G9F1_9BURK|nr:MULTISPECIES: bifunctional UDP-N-acetylmuramoyl-L-alanyl-D-glutamate--2,6-diaminopimelate ligase MurE/UDP-N-acetylmuramoyl-tripeptide--D-alanyl-D-alanine ligase MurF [Pelistega]ETD72337.1 UDP-N-acetylmuramoylalanyl-D-glutamate--2,6-diaminopimelate ligase [Pelistega indica]